ncbi:MAG TPA: DUF2844 domain-containing protein [Steroidobacteraceae bacterium]|nr:DUF2844 domain-containing protein [Steroidobacteraceae bacterium]
MVGGILLRSLVWVGVGMAALPCAHASLGGNAASIDGETLAWQGVMNAEQGPHYLVREITNGSGMDIREYSNARGIVFAVSWKDPAPPDLRRLLGTYFGGYAAALASLDHPGLHRSVRIAAPGVVVESGGHLRAYAGRAYLPAEIPPGVTLTALR